MSMVKIVLEKTDEFDNVHDNHKEELERIFSKEYQNLNELHQEMHKEDKHGVKRLPSSIYMPKRREIGIDTLPFTIKEWPLYYDEGDNLYGKYIIAKIKVID